jgi:hypothetical protein
MERNMEKHPFDDYRKEIKFLVPISFLSQVEIQLRKMQFIEQYLPRIVHSIYYDTFFDDLLNDSMDGLSDRQKIRVRYYNQGEGARLEKKIKSDAYGKKEIIKLPTDVVKDLELNQLTAFISKGIPTPIRPTAQIKYLRNYYFLENENVRITIDQQIETKEFVFGRRRDLSNFFLIEIKCARKKHFELNLPLMPHRFSKYAFARFAD